jgi:5'-methylthioadenosine phosphorylase
VSVEAVVAMVKKNARLAREVIAGVVSRIPDWHECVAATALKGAIMTEPGAIPQETRERLAPIIGRYLS